MNSKHLAWLLILLCTHKLLHIDRQCVVFPGVLTEIIAFVPTGSITDVKWDWTRTGVWLGCPIRSGRRQGRAQAHPQHSSGQGWVPRAEPKQAPGPWEGVHT